MRDVGHCRIFSLFNSAGQCRTILHYGKCVTRRSDTGRRGRPVTWHTLSIGAASMLSSARHSLANRVQQIVSRQKCREILTTSTLAPFRRGFKSKVMPSAKAATADIKDGDTILVGGFGLCGIPESLIFALREQVRCRVFPNPLLSSATCPPLTHSHLKPPISILSPSSCILSLVGVTQSNGCVQ